MYVFLVLLFLWGLLVVVVRILDARGSTCGRMAIVSVDSDDSVVLVFLVLVLDVRGLMYGTQGISGLLAAAGRYVV